MTADSRDMVIIHRVFRREFALLPDLIEATPGGDVARADRLAVHLDLLLAVLDHHHEGEDLLLWPLLAERAPERAELLAAMDGQHSALHARLAALAASLAVWRRTAEPAAAAALAADVRALLPPLTAHLDHEEAEILPLVDALLDQSEWSALGERAFSLLSPADAMVVLAQMAEQSPAAEWSWFLAHLPEPVQRAYVEVAAPAYPAYVAAVRS